MIQDVVSEILGRVLDVEAYVDSQTDFNVLVKDGATAER